MNAPTGNADVYRLEVGELRKERDQLRIELASARRDVSRMLAERRALSRSLRRLWAEARGERELDSREPPASTPEPAL